MPVETVHPAKKMGQIDRKADIWYKSAGTLARGGGLHTQKTTLNLPEDLHAEAKAEAARSRMSLTQLVVQALQRELARINTKRKKEGR